MVDIKKHHETTKNLTELDFDIIEEGDTDFDTVKNLPKVVKSKKGVRAEINKLRTDIYLGAVSPTDSPHSLYISGRIRLPPVVIADAMKDIISEIPQESLNVQAQKGLMIYDKLLEKATEILDEPMLPQETNRTILTVTHVLEKKTDWLERWGMKPKVVDESTYQERDELTANKMREIFQKQRGQK